LSKKARLVVLISGSGTNLQAILNACLSGDLPASVTAVISDKQSAYGLERARSAGVPAVYFPYRNSEARQQYDSALARKVLEFNPDLIILAGWMRLLSMAFLAHFPRQVINLHPALPGTFPGIHAVKRAYKAYQAGKTSHTGVMVHFVPDEGVDDGPVILQEMVPILPKDSLESLEDRIHQVEHRLLVMAIQQVISL